MGLAEVEELFVVVMNDQLKLNSLSLDLPHWENQHV